MKTTLNSMVFALTAWLLAPSGPCLAQGIPEPSLVLYGTIRNTADNNVRLITGQLVWQYRDTGSGRTVEVVGQVTNILDQFSYVLLVPCETLIAGPVSSNAIQLTPTARLFDRGQVRLWMPSWTGGWNTYPAVFVNPAQATTSIASTDRGRIERVDLTVHIPIVDLDGNGLPDDWETWFFGFVGVDPNGDDDGDGLSNWAEYRAGTDPTDPNSVFKFVHYFPHPAGGFQVEWSSAEGRFYRLERSTTLLQNSWSLVRTNIAATPPTNTFHDVNALPPGPWFYRLRLEQ